MMLSKSIISALALSLAMAGMIGPAWANSDERFIFRYKDAAAWQDSGSGENGGGIDEEDDDDTPEELEPVDPEDEGEPEEPSHEPLTVLLNADFEDASDTSWKVTQPSSTYVRNEGQSDKLLGGERFARIGGPGHLYQVLEMPEEIADRGFPVSIYWLQASDTETSSGRVDAVFLDEQEDEIGRISSQQRSFAAADVWFERAVRGEAPAGSRFVRVELPGTAGAKFDNIDLRLDHVRYSTILGHSGMPPREADRLFDASTTVGPTGTMSQMSNNRWWRQSDGFAQMFLNSYRNPFLGQVTSTFAAYGSSNNTVEFHQMVHVGRGYAGRQFWLEWFQDGHANVRAEFYSRQEGILLGSLTPAYAATPGKHGTYAFRTAAATLPVGTENIRIIQRINRGGRVADIGIGIEGVNFSRRGITETSGVPTTCGSTRTFNPTLRVDGDIDNEDWLRYWGVDGYQTTRFDRGGGNNAVRIAGAGQIRGMLCVPRHEQADFEGLFTTFEHIQEDPRVAGARLAVEFYDSDLQLVRLGHTEWAMSDAVGTKVLMDFVPAYGWIEEPSGNLADISTILIRSERFNNRYVTLDNIGAGAVPVQIPGEPDMEEIWDMVYPPADSARVVRR